MKSLKEIDSIVIKEADKGGAVVVMNKTYYYSIAIKTLQDEETKKFSKTLKNLLLNSEIAY